MKNSYFFSQVHQIFFTLSFVNSTIFMAIFALSYGGFLDIYVNVTLYHAISLIFLTFTPAFIGFLFTTFPRFLSQQPIDKKIYTNLFFIFVAATILNLLGAFFSEILFKISLNVLLIGVSLTCFILYRLHSTSQMVAKDDTKFILIGFTAAPISLILFIFNFEHHAKEVAIFNFLFLVAFSVGQRMVPFFSNIYPQKDKKFMPIVAILLGLGTLLEALFPNFSFVTNFALSIIIAKEILNWRLPNAKNFAMLYILHIALLWIPVAFLLGSITKAMTLFFTIESLSFDIHILMLGFLLTILIGFGTRVTIGHSGNQIKDTLFIKWLFILTQIVIISRLIVSIADAFNLNYLPLFFISATLWIALFLLWIFKFLKLFIKKGMKI